MATHYHPKKLLVEGQDDLRVIPQLMEKNGIHWGVKQKEAIVLIEECGGYENITYDRISTELQTGKCTHLGLIIDADENPKDRWQSIRNACLKVEAIRESIDNFPEEMPESGIIINIINNQDNQKFGVWMMPDNQNRGMLETFLAYMIKDESDPLWQYTQEVITAAKNRGAKFKDSYIDKARIHSWLAWQKYPGRQLHDAVKLKILDPQHPKAQVFVKWFKDLYDL